MENDATGFQNPPNLLVFSPPAATPRRALRMASPRCSRGSSRGACSRVVAALTCSALALVVLATAGFSRRGAPSGPLGAGSLLLRSKPGTRRGAPFSTPRAAREAEAGSALAAFEAARLACAARGSGICPVCGACVDGWAHVGSSGACSECGSPVATGFALVGLALLVLLLLTAYVANSLVVQENEFGVALIKVLCIPLCRCAWSPRIVAAACECTTRLLPCPPTTKAGDELLPDSSECGHHVAAH